MTISHILVTNILPTGTAFGVRESDHREGVFIPARITTSADFKVGQRIRALLVPNQSHRDLTPWVVLRLADDTEQSKIAPPMDPLSAAIMSELKMNGSATIDELTNSLGQEESTVKSLLGALLMEQHVTSYIVFELTDPLFLGTQNGGAA